MVGKIYSKKIQIKNPSQSRPVGPAVAPGPPLPPPLPPSPSPVERIELPHGPGGGVGHGGHGWSAGLPAAGPAGHRPADINLKLGPSV